MTSAIKIEEDPSFQNNSSCADEKELESTFNTISPIHSKLHTSVRNVVNITKATWQKIGRFYSLCKKPSTPFVCFVLGYVEKNYLIDQGSFNQYSLTIKVDNATECAITNLLESCPEKGALSPLNKSTFKCGIKYDKAFDEASRKAHNGEMAPFPHVSDVRNITGDIPKDLCDLPVFEAPTLTPNSLVAIAFTMTNYTFKSGGISAKLEHVYVLKLGEDSSEVLQTPRKKRVITLSDSDSE